MNVINKNIYFNK